MDIRVAWADFRIPPINLWVMPQWKPDWHGTGKRLSHHRVAPFSTSLLRRRFLQLLTARGREG